MQEPQLITGDLYKKKKKFSPAVAEKEVREMRRGRGIQCEEGWLSL